MAQQYKKTKVPEYIHRADLVKEDDFDLIMRWGGFVGTLKPVKINDEIAIPSPFVDNFYDVVLPFIQNEQSK